MLFFRSALLFLLLAGCASMQVPTAPLAVSGEPALGVIGIAQELELDFVPVAGSPISTSHLSGYPGKHARQVVVLFHKKGEGTLTLTRPNGQLFHAVYNVISQDDAAKLSQVQRLLSGIEGISVKQVGPIITVDGALQNPETALRDFDRIHEISNLYTCNNLVELSDSLYEKAAAKMTEMITADPASRDIRVVVVSHTFLVLGRAATLADRERAEAIVQTLLPPLKSSRALQENELTLGAKKYSIRNLVMTPDGGRTPASVK